MKARKLKKRRRTKHYAALYNIRVKLYADEAMKLKQVLFCNEKGHVWSAEILDVILVDK